MESPLGLKRSITLLITFAHLAGISCLAGVLAVGEHQPCGANVS